MKHEAYDEIYQLKFTNVDQSEIPQELKPVLVVYKDVFQEQLPDEMPSTRSVNFELHMKPDAVTALMLPIVFKSLRKMYYCN